MICTIQADGVLRRARRLEYGSSVGNTDDAGADNGRLERRAPEAVDTNRWTSVPAIAHVMLFDGRLAPGGYDLSLPLRFNGPLLAAEVCHPIGRIFRAAKVATALIDDTCHAATITNAPPRLWPTNNSGAEKCLSRQLPAATR